MRKSLTEAELLVIMYVNSEHPVRNMVNFTMNSTAPADEDIILLRKGREHMKKLIAALLIVATCALALAGCGSSGSAAPAAQAEKNVTLKIGFQANTSSNE